MESHAQIVDADSLYEAPKFQATSSARDSRVIFAAAATNVTELYKAVATSYQAGVCAMATAVRSYAIATAASPQDPPTSIGSNGLSSLDGRSSQHCRRRVIDLDKLLSFLSRHDGQGVGRRHTESDMDHSTDNQSATHRHHSSSAHDLRHASSEAEKVESHCNPDAEARVPSPSPAVAVAPPLTPSAHPLSVNPTNQNISSTTGIATLIQSNSTTPRNNGSRLAPLSGGNGVNAARHGPNTIGRKRPWCDAVVCVTPPCSSSTVAAITQREKHRDTHLRGTESEVHDGSLSQATGQCVEISTTASGGSSSCKVPSLDDVMNAINITEQKPDITQHRCPAVACTSSLISITRDDEDDDEAIDDDDTTIAATSPSTNSLPPFRLHRPESDGVPVQLGWRASVT